LRLKEVYHIIMSEYSTCTESSRALQTALESSTLSLDFAENADICYNGENGDLGCVDASMRVHAMDLINRSRSKRVGAGGVLRFQLGPRLHPVPVSCATVAMKGVVRVANAHIELFFGSRKSRLSFSVSSADNEFGGLLDLIVPVPADAALGSEVVLRRVSVAGCDVALDGAPVRFIVGINHESAPEGRLYRAAEAGDIPALTQALDDGCSTQEADEVGFTLRSSCSQAGRPTLESF
jgi:hypothetical protein